MTIYRWILLTAYAVSFFSAFVMFLTVLLKKGIADSADAKGKINSAIIYSFTGGMSPKKKESAYLHLPTYAAGMLFHIGTFLSFLWLIIIFFNFIPGDIFLYGSGFFILVTSVCGISILIKRMVKNELRLMSNPDDYISNILVTTFQFVTALVLLSQISSEVLFICASILFIYIPVGKLKHAIYFFTSRVELGIHYGKRGVWPVK